MSKEDKNKAREKLMTSREHVRLYMLEIKKE